ncbi:hypothetical protein Vadar_006684 [Vaccinium darrowii]|uniref:Uncharacterized protein n=1 Tax=Vaccinium darrowii TaxID=229202 RepID=A0ACB7ZIS2_9ERIC|nr:hypothetical protein Vadar_006684 [Vaccinium darrowii]
MKTLLFFIVVTIAAPIVQSAPPHRRLPPPSSSDSHHIQFVLTWSPVFCRINSCNLQIMRRKFYLHGLWLAMADRGTLTNCEGQKYTGDVLRKLTNVPHQGFWRHEWNTRGVCNPKLTVISYFNQGVLKVFGIDLLQVLEDGGIVPSDYLLYTRKQITDAIEARIGAGNRVYLWCIIENPNGLRSTIASYTHHQISPITFQAALVSSSSTTMAASR